MIGIEELQTSAHALIDVISTTYNLNNNQNSTTSTTATTTASASGAPKSIVDIIFNNNHSSQNEGNENFASGASSVKSSLMKEEDVTSSNNAILVQKMNRIPTSSVSPTLSSTTASLLQPVRRASLGMMGPLPTTKKNPTRPQLPQGGSSSNLSTIRATTTLPTTIIMTTTPAPARPPLRRRPLGSTTIGLTSNFSTTTMPPPLVRRGSYGSTPISNVNITAVRNEMFIAQPPVRRHSVGSSIVSNMNNNISTSELPAVIKMPSRRGSLGGVFKEEEQRGGADKEMVIKERCRRVGEAKEKIKFLKDKLKEVEVRGVIDIYYNFLMFYGCIFVFMGHGSTWRKLFLGIFTKSNVNGTFDRTGGFLKRPRGSTGPIR